MRRKDYRTRRGWTDPPWHWVTHGATYASRWTACGRRIVQVMEEAPPICTEPPISGQVCLDCVLALAGLDSRRDVP